jgi:hypothetical protein
MRELPSKPRGPGSPEGQQKPLLFSRSEGLKMLARRARERGLVWSAPLQYISGQKRCRCALHPAPRTLHPATRTLHPAPCTLGQQQPLLLSRTEGLERLVRRARSRGQDTQYTIHTTHYTLHTTPCTLHPATEGLARWLGAPARGVRLGSAPLQYISGHKNGMRDAGCCTQHTGVPQ